MPLRSGRETLRQVGLALGLIAAVVIFGAVVHHHYPLEKWLVWKYAKAWLWALVWALACLAGGFELVRRLVPGPPLRERMLFGFAIGVYAFHLAMFLGGLAGIYGPVFAVALPVAFVAAGAKGLAEPLRRAVRLRRRFPVPRPRPWFYAPVVAFGVLCVLLLYVNQLTPKNASFDTQWYHLGLAEGWAVTGEIARSPEGSFVAALPQLSALLYTWAYLVPGLDYFEQIELAAHQEVVIFIATLASIPLLVRRLVPHARARVGLSWVALFLFPAIFIYDASLVTGSDHIAAFWAVPTFLAFLRAWPRLEPRACALLAAMLAAAILTKYQAASLVAFPAAGIAGRALWCAARRRPHVRWLAGPLAAVAAGLLLSAPHWLKNWVWYGDPFFPALYRHLELRPWHPDMAPLMELNWKRLVWRPEGTLLEQLWESARAVVTFSFRSHARRQFHGQWPVFGSLFTLSVLLLPFLRRTRRVWALFLAANLGVFVWYYLSHVERYLQALVPWMAAVVAAVLVLAWERGRLVRALVVPVVGLQVLWGADAWFLPTHAMLRDAPIREVARLASSGYRGDWADRERFFGGLQHFGDRLPEGATVLVHEYNPRLGLRARVVTDMIGFQSGIHYGRQPSARAVYDQLRAFGVTHVVRLRGKSRGFDSLAGDLRFYEFVHRATERVEHRRGMELLRLRDEPPPDEATSKVAYLGCGPTYGRGLFDIARMTLPARSPERGVKPDRPIADGDDGLRAALAEAQFVVYDRRCKGAPPASMLSRDFVRMARRGREELWVRR